MTAASHSAHDQQSTNGLNQELRRDFAHACTAFAAARRRQRVKDTPANRNAVLESCERIDAVLDIYLMYRCIEPNRPEPTVPATSPTLSSPASNLLT